ncbi:MAG: hypothetical protein ACI857_000353 [Arenicella sp.]|jgi:hypothetical protein
MYEEAPLLITSNVDEQLKIQLYDLKVLKGSIEPTELGRDRIEMEGKWKQTSTLKYFNLFFPYLAPAATDSLFEFDRNDSLAELHIFGNQMTISQHNLKFTYDFWASFSGEHIYFDMPDSMERFSYWHIDKAANNKLEIYNGYPSWRSFGSEKVYFEQMTD